MITNERQYKITRAQAEKMKVTISSFDLKEATKRIGSPLLAKAELDAIQSEFEILSAQIQEYETLKSGAVKTFKTASLNDLPKILIKARIAKGLSQRELAELLNMKEQQMQRYESEEYASASLSRLLEVANILELNISEIAEFKSNQNIIKNNDELIWEQFPIKEMYRRNWFEDFSGSLPEAMDNAEELVREFITNSLEKPLSAAARQRVRVEGAVNRYGLLAWQCRVVTLARREDLKKSFKQNNLSSSWFLDLIQLSQHNNGPQRAIEFLKESGLPVLIVPHLPNTYLDGAAFMLAQGPVIALTLRYDRLDNFWFVLMHEIIHVIKHLQKENLESIFDDLDAKANDIEAEADKLSGEVFVPENIWETAIVRYVRTKEAIIDFATERKLHPAIIAGKIRREANNFTILTDMVGQGEVRKLFPQIDFS